MTVRSYCAYCRAELKKSHLKDENCWNCGEKIKPVSREELDELHKDSYEDTLNQDSVDIGGYGKQYRIYYHEVYGYEVIKSGWSWGGFFFGGIWAIANRLPVHGLLLLGIPLIASFVLFPLWWFCAIIGWFMAGAQGNEWKATMFKKKNYTMLSTVRAGSRSEALEKYKAHVENQDGADEKKDPEETVQESPDKTIANQDIKTRMKKLQELYDEKLITKEEFSTRKEELLREI
ncbi:SHOCT domain-containing protein [Candidatus Neomarinimicrobiota bacterium]